MLIKKSQAILKCFIDLKSSFWFTLGSEDENISFVTLRTLFSSSASQGFQTLNDQQSYILRKISQIEKIQLSQTIICRLRKVKQNLLRRGSGRVFSGFGIWPKYGAGIGKMINILTGSGIWLFPGNRDSPKIGYGMRDLCLHVCRECRKPSRPTGSSGQSESTRRALSDVSRADPGFF